MAKKTGSKKKTSTRSAKRTGKKKASGSRAAGKKAPAKRSAKKSAKKPTARRASGRSKAAKSASKKKSAARKKTSKKAASRRRTTASTGGGKKKSAGRKKASATARKSAARSKKGGGATKKSGGTAKKSAARAASKKKSAGRAAASKKRSTETKKKSASRAAATTPPAQAAPAGGEGEGRKGITIKKKTSRRPRAPTGSPPMMPMGVPTLGSPFGKPLIPSGPAAGQAEDAQAGEQGKSRKTPYRKRDLDKFRNILEEKKRELLGQVNELEEETLRGSESGSKSVSQNVDDQSSEAAEQSISLDLVAAERKLLNEIYAALRRIDDRTYGICELTGRPIRRERLEELPWTRYSIEAARELERRSLRP